MKAPDGRFFCIKISEKDKVKLPNMLNFATILTLPIMAALSEIYMNNTDHPPSRWVSKSKGAK